MVKTRSLLHDNFFDIINYTILTLILLIVIYPLYFIVIASISNPNFVANGEVWLLPKGINFEGFKSIFKDPIIGIGYKNTLIYTFLGTIINIIITLSAAYALSRKDLAGRNLLMFIFVFTMFFSGGMIPTYLIVKKLHLIGTIWAMVIPNALSVYYLIIARTFFQSTIPDELLEAALISGCSNIRFYTAIVLPLSKALAAVMILFYGIAHWNSFFDALLYLNKEEMYPLQLILRNILLANMMREKMHDTLVDSVNQVQNKADIIKFGIIIVASLPVLIIYPFIQKYFIKGVMIGAIKG